MNPMFSTEDRRPFYYAPRGQPRTTGVSSFAFGAVLLFALLAVPFLLRVLGSAGAA